MVLGVWLGLIRSHFGFPIVVEVKPAADLKFSFGEVIAHKNHDTSSSDDNHRISE